MVREKVTKRYSEAFKLKVVSEIENGKFKTLNSAREVYDIKGGDTIQSWIKRYGKNHLLDKVVRVETKNEVDKIKQLEKEKRDLEKALADSRIELMYARSENNVFKRFIGEDTAEQLKKNSE